MVDKGSIALCYNYDIIFGCKALVIVFCNSAFTYCCCDGAQLFLPPSIHQLIFDIDCSVPTTARKSRPMMHDHIYISTQTIERLMEQEEMASSSICCQKLSTFIYSELCQLKGIVTPLLVSLYPIDCDVRR